MREALAVEAAGRESLLWGLDVMANYRERGMKGKKKITFLR